VSERAFAELVLRSLLDAAFVPAPVAVDWEVWQRLAERNAVIVRLADRLAGGPLDPPAAFHAAAARERSRVRGVHTVIGRMAEACTRRAIPHVFLKAHRHYPDLGRDVDLLVPRESHGIDALVVSELKAVPRPRDLRSRTAGRRSYLVDGAVELDVHHGRLGECGEQRLLPRLLVERRRPFAIAGRDVWAPSPENALLLQGLQLVRGRLSFRLSEVLYTISVVMREPVDWDYVIDTARQIGALASLSCYLAYVTQIYQHVFPRHLLPEAVARRLRLDGWGRVEFTGGAFRFPLLRVGGRVYVSQLGADLRSGRWDSVGRLALLPVLAAAAGLQRLTRKPLP
jgi:hypothetical protein